MTEYGGYFLSRVTPSGYWLAWRSGELRLMADTRDGIRSLIREANAS